MKEMKVSKRLSPKFHDYHPELASFRDEVLAGLTKAEKEIPCKFFYDRQGLELFNQICQLEEYYPTRTEISILREYRSQISELLGKHCLIIEYGSGSSQKIRLLLDSLREPLAYMPIDISREYLF